MKLQGQQALIALGANLPHNGRPPEDTLFQACAALESAGLGPLLRSRLFATPCFPAGAGPDYVNAAAVVTVPDGWDAGRLLACLHDIEDLHGRQRVQRWGMRTLDLDLLAWDDAVLPDLATLRYWMDLPSAEQSDRTPDRLVLPHPRIQDRAFVLVPLLDVAPHWRHPVTGRTVEEMAARLPQADRAEVRPLHG